MGLLKIISNKYLITLALFVVWMMFFDVRDWSLLHARHNRLRELQKSEAQLNRQIAETQQELKLLQTNAATIEKYAREKYYMKKDNEDLFIVK